LVTVSIDDTNNWVVYFSDQTFITSSKSHFEKTGLWSKLERLQKENIPVRKIQLGPHRSWVIETQKYGIEGRPGVGRVTQARDFEQLFKSLNLSRAQFKSLGFRMRGDNSKDYNYALTTESQYFKSGTPESPLGTELRSYIKSRHEISHVALAPDGRFVLISEKRIRPSSIDILGQIEVDTKSGVTLQDRMRLHRVPGVVLAHIKGGRLYDIRSYGYKNFDDYAPNNSYVYTGVASISKTVASAAIVKAHEEGEIDIDRGILEWLALSNGLPKEWIESLPSSRARMLLPGHFTSLLNHTSGLSVHGVGSRRPEDVVSTRDILMGENGREKTIPLMYSYVDFDYSGGAYTLAEALIEDEYNTSFADFVRNKLFSPLGIVYSTMGSLGYIAKRNYFYPHNADDWKSYGYMECGGKAAGGLFTIMSDLSKYVQMLLSKGRVNPSSSSKVVLREESVEKLMTPATHPNSSLNYCDASVSCTASSNEVCYFNKCIQPFQYFKKDSYSALGLEVSRDTHTDTTPVFFGHGGAHNGIRTHFKAYTKSKSAIIAFVNSDCTTASNGKKRGGCELIKELVAAFDRHKKPE
jgi:CubicO group peptidase (beta-lactamase class C family)